MAVHLQPYTKKFGQTDEELRAALSGSALPSFNAGAFSNDPHRIDIIREPCDRFSRNPTLVRPSAPGVIVCFNTDFDEETYVERTPYTQVLFPEDWYSQPIVRYEIREKITWSDLKAPSNSRGCVLLLAPNRSAPPGWSEYTTNRERSVLNRLFSSYKEDAALRLNELIEIIAQDPDDDDTLIPDSLEYAADFLIEYRPPYSPFGTISAGNDGVVSAEWRLPVKPPPDPRWKNCDGILTLRFLPSGKITFAGETRKVDDETPFFEIGEESHDIAFSQVAPFFNKLRMLDDLL